LGGEQTPETPAHPIPHHGRTERPPQRKSDLRLAGVVVGDRNAPQRAGRDSPAALAELFKARPIPDSMDQADSRARPRSRRAFKMARPARVLMRWRKPCFFARRRLLG
jgi:hypothetical protein